MASEGKDNDSLGKLFAAYLRRAEESVWVRCWWTIILSHSPSQVLPMPRIYKVDSEAIALRSNRSSRLKRKTQTAKKTLRKPKPKP